ncbi:Vacuolar membrane-associated protein IML1 OS=Cryptococcus neoformans var, neoformans serotype D (strain B-3501A) GN=IML1 PE=3 SV=1 [Rhizoctonia solani AG-1 IB]|uniref:Vacuolar membrane-associated protein IML1 n=1 Tax=Thanatephorus cucumeris (strain AG1-IB / isolate 7/3/14) TaxID=1108050 RepID=A0A0B7FPG7_THACB|nr:Vacuolar membrane-associated protein IML1 OS=Cryptococcus neoformans var, neoformans serotype D (strain B-3501A) GN=IML1 PE=3 SV=1 [Rhizoctonia solani AG-1 IB]
MNNSSPSPSVRVAHGRKRSSTISSMLPPPPQLSVGQTKWITLWAADTHVAGSRVSIADITINRESWPGLAPGDVIRVSSGKAQDLDGVLFIVPQDDATRPPTNQITVARPIATFFGFKNHSEILLTKIDRNTVIVDYVEIEFRDQYLGRCDMWRLSNSLKNSCVYVGQRVNFIGCISASIRSIYIRGKRVSSGIVDASTKAIFRSLSAKTTIFVQVCKELWEFADDGERFTEKIVHSFFPELIHRWKEHQTNHVITIVLISRVFYDTTELEYAAGPLRQTDDGQWYKDFFKVVVDLEVVSNWTIVLRDLKEAFWTFQRDILLTHHFHRKTEAGGEVKLVGTISFAHDGPLLEALNLALNPTEAHYIDRSLSLTGSSVILITPGTGYFRVQKQLLRLTTLRMLDQGFGLDLVCLAKRPLHTSPILSFQGIEPVPVNPSEGISRATDPLWGGGRAEFEQSPKDLKTFWWEPFWISASFWDKQRDMPFREDRFVTRARMYEVQMLGLLEHDVTATISLPHVDLNTISPTSPGSPNPKEARRLAREMFDKNIFAPVNTEPHPHHEAHHHHHTPTQPGSGETSGPSTTHGTDMESSQSSLNDLLEEHTTKHEAQPMPMLPFKNVRKPNLRRASTSVSTSRIRIEAAPSFKGHSPEPLPALTLPTLDTTVATPTRSNVSQRRSVSPSQESIRSTSTVSSNRRKGGGTLSSLAKNWFFTPFRPAASTAASTVHIERQADDIATGPLLPPVSPVTSLAKTSPALPDPIAITKRKAEPKRIQRPAPEDSASPSDDPAGALRRTNAVVVNTNATPAIPPQPERTNPCRPGSALPENQTNLARRWQHLFPRPTYQHQIKWRSICTPACLPLGVDYLPPQREVNATWRDYDYIVMLNPEDIRSSFLLGADDENMDQDDQALLVMRGMAALRLQQGFQFVVSKPKSEVNTDEKPHARPPKTSGKGFPVVAGLALDRPYPVGVSEVLKSAKDVVCLSMSDQIQQLSYDSITGAVLVRRWIRRSSHPTDAFQYQCLVWPKLGTGYTEVSTSFSFPVLEEYGWNRTDTLVAGYERDLSDALRYWRTRYLVIPSEESPPAPFRGSTGEGETLDEEEIRLLGVTERLAELFARARWLRPDETDLPPPRFVETTLDPAVCVLDDSLMTQIEELHAQGPLKKKRLSERVLEEMSLPNIARAMREEGGVPIKVHKWHGIQYPDSFTGRELVNWLVREFKDVSTREQGVEHGNRLLSAGLFEHCRGTHGLLDGHYYYRLAGEFGAPTTNKPRQWFRSAATLNSRPSVEDVKAAPPASGLAPGSVGRGMFAVRRPRRQLVLSQTMTIDVDPMKRSDQAERVILHHDVIHNPMTAFHFELNWLGTTARFIDDMIISWNHALKRYGLKIVEAYVDQIVDINRTNVFQSCFPIELALAPPCIPDLAKRVPEGTQIEQYFECALLKHFGYILDISAGSNYPDSVDVFYSYRRSHFTYSQYVHKSGLAFCQVAGGNEGFRWLTNRLLAPGNYALGSQGKSKHHTRADEIRRQLAAFCADETKLKEFYDDVVGKLLPPPAVVVPPASAQPSPSIQDLFD